MPCQMTEVWIREPLRFGLGIASYLAAGALISAQPTLANQVITAVFANAVSSLMRNGLYALIRYAPCLGEPRQGWAPWGTQYRLNNFALGYASGQVVMSAQELIHQMYGDDQFWMVPAVFPFLAISDAFSFWVGDRVVSWLNSRNSLPLDRSAPSIQTAPNASQSQELAVLSTSLSMPPEENQINSGSSSQPYQPIPVGENLAPQRAWSSLHWWIPRLYGSV